jgi:hypothetical protein
MPDGLLCPRYWENRAEEQRVIANRMRHPACRETMLRLAAQSEKMSEQMRGGGNSVNSRDFADTQLERVLFDIYNAGLHWIMHEHTNGGWPPRDAVKVCGWAVVRLLAQICGKSPREVANELIERSTAMGVRRTGST